MRILVLIVLLGFIYLIIKLLRFSFYNYKIIKSVKDQMKKNFNNKDKHEVVDIDYEVLDSKKHEQS